MAMDYMRDHTALTEQECIELVRLDALNVTFLKSTQLTEKVCIAAAKEYGGVLNFLKPEKITNNVANAAIEHNGFSIEYLRPDQRTPELVLASVKRSFELGIMPPCVINLLSHRDHRESRKFIDTHNEVRASITSCFCMICPSFDTQHNVKVQ